MVRCLVREGFPDCINYLDDFCAVGRDAESCWQAQWALVRMLGKVGFCVSFRKLTPASCVTKYLGIEINSVEMELRLPQDKLDKLRAQLNTFMGKRKASKLELEVLGGILVHCCKLVHGGHTFSRRVYNLIASVKKESS